MTSHNNFLAIPPVLISNEKGKELAFKVPSSYSHFQLYLLSDSNALLKKFSKDSPSEHKKDLSNKGLTNESEKEGWTMSRQIYPLREGEDIKVGSDSLWCAVSLSNIINFAQIKGCRLEEWVGQWMGYSEERKRKVLDEKFCHELNCYIKNHDPEFFRTVLRPHLQNKLVKTFVDWCLLDSDQCLEWCSIDNFYQLNAFEKVLLVQALVREGRK